MNGRTSFGVLSIALTLGCAGCITTQNQKNAETTIGPSGGGNISTFANMPKMDDTPRIIKKNDVKKQPQAGTEVASGKLMEAEADSEGAKSNPEAQAQMRDKARKAYQHALQLEPANLDAERSLARVYSKGGDFTRALDIYHKALAKNPREGKLWYDLGLCHQRRRDIPESIRCLNKALELDPENRDYLKKLGFTLAYAGHVEQGLAYLTRAQGSALAHYNIARVLLQREQIEPARRYLVIALRENSQLADARELLTSLDAPAPRSARLGPSE